MTFTAAYELIDSENSAALVVVEIPAETLQDAENRLQSSVAFDLKHPPFRGTARRGRMTLIAGEYPRLREAPVTCYERACAVMLGRL